MSPKIQILDIKAVNQKLNRLAWQVYEHNSDAEEIIVVGIANRGLRIAKQLAKNIESISKIKTTIGHLELDKDNPYNKEVSINLTSDDYIEKVVILCDDVLNSGKTLMYAAKHFLSTPLSKLSTVVLVDRNHNLYPIKSDYVGLSLATTLKEYINVSLSGSEQGVYLS